MFFFFKKQFRFTPRFSPISERVIYGYKKDPENKYHWLIDEEAAAVVRRIFQLTIEGKGPYDIARTVWRSTITAWPSSHFTMTGTPACMWQTTTMLIAALLYDRKFE